MSRFQMKYYLFAFLLLVSQVPQWPAHAQNGREEFSKLPLQIQKHATEVRKACSEMDDDQPVNYLLQGIESFDLDGQPAILVDDERLCPTPIAGANCTNRGCDLAIYRRSANGRYTKVFDYHAHGKYVMLTNDRLTAIAISIFKGSPECRADKRRSYTSGEHCHLLVKYRNGGWVWQLIE